MMHRWAAPERHTVGGLTEKASYDRFLSRWILLKVGACTSQSYRLGGCDRSITTGSLPCWRGADAVKIDSEIDRGHNLPNR